MFPQFNTILIIVITDFALHSIGIALYNLNKREVFDDFICDVFIEESVNIVTVDPEDLFIMLPEVHQYKLDFDDTYQYFAAVKFDLILVSFDKDFDKTADGRKTPGEIIKRKF